jgi:hypothetical protein
MLSIFAEGTCLKKKLGGKCPCGYVFDISSDEKAAIAQVRSHFERSHKDLLPFGITNAEALALLKKRSELGKQKSFLNNFSQLRQNPPIV